MNLGMQMLIGAVFIGTLPVLLAVIDAIVNIKELRKEVHDSMNNDADEPKPTMTRRFRKKSAIH
jgi:hypothetical protein